ncbi:hypothetical protein RIF29_20073 [Crotalaria pallida]|uniref:Uncharacterized protein n=1 Tax=Crotalaria pallida TaxID=3830 RepID=A0AAN9IC11_CROPI
MCLFFLGGELGNPYGGRILRKIKETDRFSPNWLSSSLVKKVGDGKNTKFWLDIWLRVLPLKSHFPINYSISNQKEEEIVNLGSWINGVWVWNLTWRRTLFDWEKVVLNELNILLENVALKQDSTDSWTWKAAVDGVYSVKSAYKTIQIQHQEGDNSNTASGRLGFGWSQQQTFHVVVRIAYKPGGKLEIILLALSLLINMLYGS